jgi:hypothetical protein
MWIGNDVARNLHDNFEVLFVLDKIIADDVMT